MSEQSVMVIVAALVNFFVGGFWYSLFKKKWLSAWDLEEEDINRKDPAPYLIAFIGSLWASYGLFVLLKHIQPKNLIELFTIALGLWLFVFVGLGSKHYAFSQRKLSAFLIDYGLDLVGIIIMCGLLWRVY